MNNTITVLCLLSEHSFNHVLQSSFHKTLFAALIQYLQSGNIRDMRDKEKVFKSSGLSLCSQSVYHAYWNVKDENKKR